MRHRVRGVAHGVKGVVGLSSVLPVPPPLVLPQVLRVVTSRILHDDVTMAMQNLRMLSSKGMTPSSLRCVGCGQGASTQMGGAKNDVVLFQYVTCAVLCCAASC